MFSIISFILIFILINSLSSTLIPSKSNITQYIFDSHDSNLLTFQIKKLSHRNKTYYTIPISIGDNEKVDWSHQLQQFTLALDTVNIVTWLPSINIKLNVSELSQEYLYNISKSPSGISLNNTKIIYDTNGNLYGTLILDYMNIGSYILPHLVMLEIREIEKDYDDYLYGKIGLGNKYPQLKKYLNITSSMVDILYYQNYINYRMFTIDKGTQFILGGIPYKYANENISICNITYNNELDDEYLNGWVCEITHFGISNSMTLNSFYDLSSSFSRVTFDSAYEYISLPVSYREVFYNLLTKQLMYNNCSIVYYNDITSYYVCEELNKSNTNITNLNINITFVIDGFGYVIRSNELIKKTEGKIELMVRFRNANSNLWVLGTSFFDKFTLVFNYENNTVEFYGKDRINYTNEWNIWRSNKGIYYKSGNWKILFIDEVISIIIILFSSFGYIVWKLYFRKNNWYPNEHGPLVENEQ